MSYLNSWRQAWWKDRNEEDYRFSNPLVRYVNLRSRVECIFFHTRLDGQASIGAEAVGLESSELSCVDERGSRFTPQFILVEKVYVGQWSSTRLRQ